jgi:hypothetical protein
VKFLANPSSSPSEVLDGFAAYKRYLESVKERLPFSAFEFATAAWHYDHTDHRCPHDSWVESLTIQETGRAEGLRDRSLHISVLLLGAFHDGHLSLNYTGVHQYSLKSSKAGAGHRDWLIDEIQLSENGLVLHEVSFSNNAHWLIEAKDILFEWRPTIG